MKKEACLRFAAAILALINVILNMFGCNPLPFSENGFYEIVSAVVAAASLLYSSWKNNSMTEAAVVSDKFMKLIKNGKLTVTDAEELLTSLSEETGEKSDDTETSKA